MANLRLVPCSVVGNARSARDWPEGGVAPSGQSLAVHPHARGERLIGPKMTRAPIGSSPRPWGTIGPLDQVRNVRRFIPTPVGNAQRG